MCINLTIETLGNGQDIILLPGFGFQSEVWRKIAERLSLKYRISLVDIPGYEHDHNQCPDTYTLDTIGQQLLEGLPKNAIWMGWSFGGMIAAWIAIYFPKAIDKLIMVASSPKFVSDHQWPGISEVELKSFGKQLVYNQEKTLMRFLMLQCCNNDYAKKSIKVLKKMLLHQVYNKTTLLKNLNILSETDLRADFHKIICPVLLVLGELDAVVPAKIENYFQSLENNIKIEIIKQAGHVPFISHEAEFLKIIETFL